MRNFSPGRGKEIGLYNIAQRKLIPKASIKDQSCRPWFYGRDLDTDDKLTDIEGVAHRIINEIIVSEKAPNRFSPQAQALAFFVNVQDQRTVEAVARQNEMLNKMGKHVLQRALTDPDLLLYLPKVKLNLTDPFEELLSQAVTTTPVLYDLRIKLLRNVTNTPFITSDNPVVKHNRIYQELLDRVLGLANEGLQILLPISSRLSIMFYDDKAYDVGSKGTTVVDIRSPIYVAELNAMQWLSAHHNILFASGTDPALIHAEADRFVSLRDAERMDLIVTPASAAPGRKSEIVSLKSRPSAARMSLPSVRPKVKPKPIRDFEVLPLRNPGWVRHVRRAAKALEAGTITIDQFVRVTERP